MLNFGKNLRILRKSKGYTQGQLGKLLGVSASTVGMYEQNRRAPQSTMLKRISDVFNVSTDVLLLEASPQSFEVESILQLMQLQVNSNQKYVFKGRSITSEDFSKLINAVSVAINVTLNDTIL
ncbi:MAG: helix-turn-helix transcriptional regulator [bacterium]|nr:helix-turn-helix transcriptional regulator [bacterium]